MNKVINNSILTQAFEVYEERYAADVRSFEPSDEFNKKMSKLIKSQTNVYHRMTLTKARKALAAAAIIAALIAASLSVEAIRERVFSFFITSGQDIDVIEYDANSTQQNVNSADFEISYIPDGYRLDDSGDDGTCAYFYYSRGDDYLSVERFRADSYKSASDAEYQTSADENYNGKNFIIKTDENMTMLIWEQEGYVFEAVGFIPKDELLKVASSIN